MSQEKEKSSYFLVQGSILAIASIVSRIIGLIYRLPMTNIIGDIGIGYYATAYEVYNIMLIISSYSIPLAVSKIVAAKLADDNKRAAYRTFRGAMIFAVCSGGLAALIIWFGAGFFTATLLKTPNSYFALRVLAPVLLIVAVLGVIRGFFQGMGNMVYSAISQIVEQIINAIVSVWAAYVLYQYGKTVGAVLGDVEHYAAAYGAAGGTLGTNIGSVAGLIFMVVMLLLFMRRFKLDMYAQKRTREESFRYIMYSLVRTIIPVLLSSTIYNISGIIDQGIFKNIAYLQGYSEDQVDVWWGVYTGKYKLLINVPISIASAMSVSCVPALTKSYAAKDMASVRKQIASSIRFVMVIAFPCAVGLAALATPIYTLLFAKQTETLLLSSQMMWAGSSAIIFYSISTLSNGLLQGIDRLKVPVHNAVIALVAHALLLVLLMLFFRLNIYAVIIANAFFALLMCVLNASALTKYSHYRQEYIKTFVKPGICSLIMGLVAYGVYSLLYMLSHSNWASFALAFIIAVFVYAVLLLLTRALTEEEIRSFPKGRQLVYLAKKTHLL